MLAYFKETSWATKDRQLPVIMRLKHPPEVGKFYLVPAIRMDRSSSARLCSNLQKTLWWPVMGRKHNDVEHFNFAEMHYHPDVRFLNRRHLAQAAVWYGMSSDELLARIQATPVHVLRDVAALSNGTIDLAKPVLVRMRCTRSEAIWQHSDKRAVHDLCRSHQGTQARPSPAGWVCPHRNYPLGQISPVDGVITCPMHGLRIDAETGKCIAPAEETA